MLPGQRCTTPDLSALAAGNIPIRHLNGTITKSGNDMMCFGFHLWSFKHLHIPKMVIPVGLTSDGRPSSVQLWGRAIPHEQMYNDAYSSKHDVEFLHLVKRVSDSIQSVQELKRVDAELVKDLFESFVIDNELYTG
eukprot:TRINITY_DN3974_c0_g1_i1.p1 TRINITY_DN3974_c0_g1~~TRINITY_DN3974_c0_g1_i1.p1  ORF type:complete len:136 (+),score=6.98 TRINITY_DN3974_c0_g1_i1:59-466(+)